MAKCSPEAELLKTVPYPAFLVCEGIIVKANRKAANLKIKAGTPIEAVLRTGAEEYRNFKNGRLCLTLAVNYFEYHASVIKHQGWDLFFIDSEFINEDLLMLAEAVNPLRDPLFCAMLSMECLQADPNLKENPVLATLNRHLHRLHKTVTDMSDAACYGCQIESKMTYCDVGAETSKIIKRASALLAESEHSFKFNNSISDEFIGRIDKEKIEHITLAMIADLVKVSEERKQLKVSLSRESNRLLMEFHCRLSAEKRKHIDDLLFSCYTVPDGLNIKCGSGYHGAILSRNAAASHFGTMLINSPKPGYLQFTISIPITEDSFANVRSYIEWPVEYCGGYDQHLVALSDLLPDELYK